MFKLGVFLRGIAMGAADVIPGVSGGTIAFITGIYEELIDTIQRFDLSILKRLKEEGFLKTWDYINGSFLFSLILGILLSIFTLASLVTYLLATFPILVSAFFFGLILASAIYIGNQVSHWNWVVIFILFLGIAAAFAISFVTPASGAEPSFLYLTMCGAFAICAMILPGISGAFILLLLGQYTTILQAVKTIQISTLIPVAIGAIIGLISFSKLLKYLFHQWKNQTLAVLTGFVIGALYKVWPWKKVLSTYTDSHGELQPLQEIAINPFAYESNPFIWQSVVFFILGISIVFVLEKLGKQHD